MASVSTTADLYTVSLPEAHNPPYSEMSPFNQYQTAQHDIIFPQLGDASPKYELKATDYKDLSTMTETASNKPIVVPQSTNLFFIKTFSPFVRCYSPALAKLEHPIRPEEFLAFIDRLNQVFISNPIFQAAHVAGGMLLGSQVLPAMAVGGVLQVGSLMASAGVSFVRVRKFMKEANATIFAPRGLVCKIQTTKKMIAQVGFTDTDAKGKLMLPPLENVDDLGDYNPVVAAQDALEERKEKPLGKDPRLMRLKALEGYIAPLEFENIAIPENEGKLSKIGQAPLRWMNKRQMKGLDNANAKSLKKREKQSAKVEAEELKAQKEIAELDRRMERVTDEERIELELAKRLELEKCDTAIANIYKGADKKVNKVYKKEGKVANRILWIVIDKADGTDGGSLFEVGTATA